VNRAELRAIVAELNDQNPEVQVQLRPRLATHPDLPGGHYHVDVSLTVTRSLYFNPHDDMSPETALTLAQEEIFTILQSSADRTFERLRHQRLTAWATRNPAARQLLERPLAVPLTGFRAPGPSESALVDLPSPGQPAAYMRRRAEPLWREDSTMRAINNLGGLEGYSPVPPEPLRRGTALLGIMRAPETQGEVPTAEKEEAAEPPSLWDRLEE
jgi:hypothetical protein